MSMKAMWEKLDAITHSATTRIERAINPRNEWGGYSRRLRVPVFTGWQDHVKSDQGKMRVLVCDTSWASAAGVSNQTYWVDHAIANDGEAAFFLIKAVDPLASPRVVEWLDDSRALIGDVVQEGSRTFIVAKRQIEL